ncbi:MAG: glycosyltransferase family 2 protein [Candidatus Marsarchaeota archaeon]|nr:glycosyltransferase family 2 protein [Candidatus Marsarchaeota archaeon]MCL5419197.1 glycosyltransferase family 2 protein [Candidatus Marsarchaeota archaeon]
MAVVFVAVIALDARGIVNKRETFKSSERYEPRVLVILPAKGTDLDQRGNFLSLAKQDYENYDIVAVVDTPEDEATETAAVAGIKVEVAKGRCKKCSGKNKAIAYALNKFKNYDVYVIADSDIRAGKAWLRKLIKPLADPEIGTSTTFPAFVPVGYGFWSYTKMLWGLVGQSLMSSNRTRFGWGGSLAFKKDLVDKRLMRLLEESKYAVSDDICITKRTKEKGFKIAYVKEAAPIVYTRETMHSFMEWANRQSALTLLGYRGNLYMGVAYYSSELLLFASGIVMAVLVSPLYAVLLLHFAISEYRAFSRAPKMNASIFVIAAFMPALYLYNLVKASRMKRIEWRGRSYAMQH